MFNATVSYFFYTIIWLVLHQHRFKKEDAIYKEKGTNDGA